MQVVSQLVKIRAKLPVDNSFIEAKLNEMGIEPLRWAVVECNDDTLTISVANETL